jgi:hypothetical protein
MAKVKFSTYMEVDLGGMTTDELMNLKRQVEIHLEGRLNPKNITLDVVLESDNNCHTRIGYAIKKLLNKPADQIMLSEIPEKIDLDRLKDFRNFGEKSIETLNQILIKNGISAIHN